MSVAKRPFRDPRNTYIVDNNDPTAFDKSFVGIPGTHPEQRCCGDRAPYMEGPVYGVHGNLVQEPELWCNACETALERGWSEFLGGLEYILNEAAPALRAIAMVASYVPGIGTAVSVVINTSLTLAEGGSLEESVIRGLRGALPGQPISGAIFDVTRSIAKGDPIDKTIIEGIPVDPEIKKYIGKAIAIAKDVIEGVRIDTRLLDEIRTSLPETAKKLVDVARSVVDGQPVADILIRAADASTGIPGAGSIQAAQAFRRTAEEARAKGQAAIDKFMAEVAFHGALGQVPAALREALMAGLITGRSEKLQAASLAPPISSLLPSNEQNKTTNDAYAAKGRAIIDSGAAFLGMPLSKVRMGGPFSLKVPVLDTLSGVMTPQIVSFQIYDPDPEINAQRQRGFEVAIGLCQGLTQDTLEQQKVRASLIFRSAQQGFDAGQAIQFSRRPLLERVVSEVVAAKPASSFFEMLISDRPQPDASVLAARQNSIRLGVYTSDSFNPENNDYWQILTLAGDKIRDANPGLLSQWYNLPPSGDIRRGFSIGIGIRFAKEVKPGFLRWLRIGMKKYPALLIGLDKALALPDLASAVKETEMPVIRETEMPVIRETEMPVIRETEMPVIRETEISPEVQQTILRHSQRISWVDFYRQKKAQDPTIESPR
jgi:hypothetical protein